MISHKKTTPKRAKKNKKKRKEKGENQSRRRARSLPPTITFATRAVPHPLIPRSSPLTHPPHQRPVRPLSSPPSLSRSPSLLAAASPPSCSDSAASSGHPSQL
ncbi:hypothetical protein VPH35_124120 [Triticum aestivum]